MSLYLNLIDISRVHTRVSKTFLIRIYINPCDVDSFDPDPFNLD